MTTYLLGKEDFALINAPDSVMDQIRGYMNIFNNRCYLNIKTIESTEILPDQMRVYTKTFPNYDTTDAIRVNSLEEFDKIFLEKYLSATGWVDPGDLNKSAMGIALLKARELLNPDILERMRHRSILIPNMYRTKSASKAYFVNANNMDFLEPFTFGLLYFMDENSKNLIRMDELDEFPIHARTLPEFAQRKGKKFYTVVECDNRRVEVYGETEELVETAVRALRKHYPNLIEVK